MVRSGLRWSAVIVGLLVLAGCGRGETAPAEEATSSGVAELAAARPGVTVTRVTYGPGESSAPHSHECPVVGYVQYGKVRMQLEGDKPAVYEAGETFHEPAGRAHLISANASAEHPAGFVAWVSCEGETPLALGEAAGR